MPVRPQAIELRRVRLPLVEPFRTSSGVQRDRVAVLVRAFVDGAEGWGECAALEAPGYTSEYVDGAIEVLRRFLVPRVLAGESTAAVRGHPMAKAALSTAVLDATLRLSGTSLAQSLGAVRDRVEVGVAVGIASSVDELLDVVARRVAEGYRRVKLKIQPGWDVEPVAAVRSRFGDVALSVDANGSYAGGDVAHLRRLDEFGLVLVEQPLPADDLVGHAELARALRTPVCLDESISSAGDAAAAVALGACSVVNVKPGRVGGLAEAVAVHDVCAAAGVPVWCGGMLETGLGRAACLALAALPNFTLPADLSASERYYAEDLTEPFVLEDGCLRVPDGPGIGVSPRPDVLAVHTDWSERFPSAEL